MEIKKNPQVDPKRNSALYLQLGLTFVLLLTYIGIEHKSPDPVEEKLDLVVTDNFVDDEEMILTMPPVQKLPPPPPPAPEVIEVVKDEIKLEEKKIETTEVEEKKAVVVAKATDVGSAGGDDLDDVDEVAFAVIEQVPMFPGCEGVPKSEQMDCFNRELQKHIKKNFRYPDRAIEDDIQGRVYVQFMIEKDGTITVLNTRGPKGGELLEKEGARNVEKLPKLTPGKQRGKAVRVKYAVPINFQLQ